MRRHRVLLALSTLAVAFAAPAAAQSLPLLVEVRGDAAAPIGGDTDRTQLGYGLGGTVSVGFAGTLEAYAGYDYVRFDDQRSPDLIEDELERIELNMGRAGLRALVYPSRSRVDVFVEGGALFAGGDVGGEGGIGVLYAIGRRSAEASLTPRVSYRRVGDLDWVSFGVGLRLRP